MRRKGLAEDTVNNAITIFRRFWRLLHAKNPTTIAACPHTLISQPGKQPRFYRDSFDAVYPPPVSDQETARDLAIFFERVYRPRRLLGASPTTTAKYVSVLLNFARFLGRRLALD